MPDTIFDEVFLPEDGSIFDGPSEEDYFAELELRKILAEEEAELAWLKHKDCY